MWLSIKPHHSSQRLSHWSSAAPVTKWSCWGLNPEYLIFFNVLTLNPKPMWWPHSAPVWTTDSIKSSPSGWQTECIDAVKEWKKQKYRSKDRGQRE